MSNARINIADQLASIIAPNLDASNYAQQLNQVFTNIDNNFTKLANHDFIKGERGDSVKIHEVELISSTTNNTVENEYNIEGLTVFGKLLLDSIKNNFITNIDISDISIDENTKLTWLDNFKSNPGKLYMIYDATASSIDEDKAYSSLYYTFLDGRYANNTIGKLDPSNYQDVSDMSCIAVYDKNLNGNTGGFKIISNAFPTIYYEDGIGLCWKVNGNNTGIPVQGVKGEAGVSSAIYIVSAELTVNSGLAEGPVTGIFEPFTGYKNVANIDISSYDNCTALVMTNNLNKDARSGGNGNEFYFGTLKTKTENDELKLFASCNPTTSITQSIGVESVINSMKNIDIFATGDAVDSIPRGLFIPISDEIETELEDGSIKREQPVHLISATPISDEEGTISDDKTDIIFTPVNDYNSVKLRSESNEETAKKLKVDKYLYVQINKNHNTVKYNYITQNLWGENTSGVSAGAGTNFFIESFGDITDHTDNKLKYDGVLKYKLDCVVDLSQDYTAIFDEKYTCTENGIYNGINNTTDTGSISYGKDFMYLTYEENNNNTSCPVFAEDSRPVYYTNGNNMQYEDGNESLETSDSHRFSIPSSFANKKIFRWVLCNIQNDWDIEELKKYSESEYTFPDSLRCIYTTEMSPSTKTEFLWFNGYDYYYGPETIKWITYNNENIVSSLSEWIYGRGLEKISNLIKAGSDGQSPLIQQAHSIANRDLQLLYKPINNDNGYEYDNLSNDNLVSVISGWSIYDTNNEPLLIFKKFVPIYNNDFCLDNDTTLNLNYNVNITGDKNYPNKSITVHGSVNCDNINVHNLTSSGEIKNIFTNDTIIGNKGINLCNSNNTYNYVVDELGNLTTNGDITCNHVNTRNITNTNFATFNGYNVFNGPITCNDINCNGIVKLIKLNKLFGDIDNTNTDKYAVSFKNKNDAISLNLNNINNISINTANKYTNTPTSGIINSYGIKYLNEDSLFISTGYIPGSKKCSISTNNAIGSLKTPNSLYGNITNWNSSYNTFVKLSGIISSDIKETTTTLQKYSNKEFNFVNVSDMQERTPYFVSTPNANILSSKLSIIGITDSGADGVLSNVNYENKLIIESDLSNFSNIGDGYTYAGLDNIQINFKDSGALFTSFMSLTAKMTRQTSGIRTFNILDTSTLSLEIHVRLGEDYTNSEIIHKQVFKPHNVVSLIKFDGFDANGVTLENQNGLLETRFLPLVFMLDNINISSGNEILNKVLGEDKTPKNLKVYVTIENFSIDVQASANANNIRSIGLFKPTFCGYIKNNSLYTSLENSGVVPLTLYSNGGANTYSLLKQGYLCIINGIYNSQSQISFMKYYNNASFGDINDNNVLKTHITYNTYYKETLSETLYKEFPMLSTTCCDGVVMSSYGNVYGFVNIQLPVTETDDYTGEPCIALYDISETSTTTSNAKMKFIKLKELHSLLSSQAAASLLEYGI